MSFNRKKIAKGKWQQRRKQGVGNTRSSRNEMDWSESAAVRRDLSIYKAPVGTIMPDQLECTLIYQDGAQTRASLATNYGYWVYKANSAYDVDPLTGSSGMSGFLELANFYNYYRVDRFSINMPVSNKDTTAFTFSIVPTCNNIAPLAISRAAAINIAENAREMTTTLAPTGGPPCRLFKSFDIGTIYGNRMQQRNDVNFAASTLGNPAQLIYCNVLYWTDGTTPTIGFVAAPTLKMLVRFYHRATLVG